MKNYFIARSRRVRSTPYTSRIENQGVNAYTVYNHMLLPAAFGSLEDSYHHLKEHVQFGMLPVKGKLKFLEKTLQN